MIALRGTYQNGILQLEKKIESEEKLDVIVTFLEDSKSVNEKKASLLEKLKNGPVMSDEQYEEYLEGKNGGRILGYQDDFD